MKPVPMSVSQDLEDHLWRRTYSYIINETPLYELFFLVFYAAEWAVQRFLLDYTHAKLHQSHSIQHRLKHLTALLWIDWRARVIYLKAEIKMHVWTIELK